MLRLFALFLLALGLLAVALGAPRRPECQAVASTMLGGAIRIADRCID